MPESATISDWTAVWRVHYVATDGRRWTKFVTAESEREALAKVDNIRDLLRVHKVGI